jgi:hypothetical protein
MEIPRSVVETDHRLEGAHDRASEELAQHRWHCCLDPDGPKYPIRQYARAVGRNDATIARYAKGWALYVDRLAAPRAGGAFSLQDAIRQSEMSVENQEFAEAIADGAGKPVAQVSRGDNRHKMHEIVGHAKERAERRGTNPVDEARDIARHQRQSKEMDERNRKAKAKARSLRFVEIEGDLAAAKRRLLHALRTAEGVGFAEEEMELIRDTIGTVQAILQLLDLRMAGTPDVDWDGELEKLSAQ